MLADAAGVQLEGRVLPVVRSRAEGISRAALLSEKVRLWAEVTSADAAPLLQRLELLAHRDPVQIAQAILAGGDRGEGGDTAADEAAMIAGPADGGPVRGEPAARAVPAPADPAEIDLF